MSGLKIEQLDAGLNALVSTFDGALPDAGIETLMDLLAVREYKVAFEVLCDLLAEEQLTVPRDVFTRLVAIGEALQVAPSYWMGVAREAE